MCVCLFVYVCVVCVTCAPGTNGVPTGKDLSRISMPVALNEPLSALQVGVAGLLPGGCGLFISCVWRPHSAVICCVCGMCVYIMPMCDVCVYV